MPEYESAEIEMQTHLNYHKYIVILKACILNDLYQQSQFLPEQLHNFRS